MRMRSSTQPIWIISKYGLRSTYSVNRSTKRKANTDHSKCSLYGYDTNYQPYCLTLRPFEELYDIRGRISGILGNERKLYRWKSIGTYEHVIESDFDKHPVKFSIMRAQE